MDYTNLRATGEGVVLEGVRHFCLEDILDCGQCFRWERLADGSFRGTVEGRVRQVSQQGDTLTFHRVTGEEFESLWHGYFDFGRDYGEVKTILSADPAMRDAIAFTPGMRVLRQEPFETLCSFIMSANNNIARIRGILHVLCERFGEPVEGGRAFPTPERLATLTEEDLAPVRCGYRAGYLLDAARRVAQGQLELAPLYTLPIPEARARLQQVKGVGPKVADCVLLYGFARAQCVPADVWIKRALKALYPSGMPDSIHQVAGIGQQYLFHYVRHCPEALEAGQPAAAV